MIESFFTYLDISEFNRKRLIILVINVQKVIEYYFGSDQAVSITFLWIFNFLLRFISLVLSGYSTFSFSLKVSL